MLVSDGAAEGRTHDGARDVSQYVTDDVTRWRRACAVCVRAWWVAGPHTQRQAVVSIAAGARPVRACGWSMHSHTD